MEYRRYCTEGEKGEKGGWEENGDGKGSRLMGGSFVHPLYPRIAALLCLRAWVWQGLLQPACIGLGRSALFAVAGKLPARLDPTSPSASLSPACPALTSKLFMQPEPPHRLLTLHPPPALPCSREQALHAACTLPQALDIQPDTRAGEGGSWGAEGEEEENGPYICRRHTSVQVTCEPVGPAQPVP